MIIAPLPPIALIVMRQSRRSLHRPDLPFKPTPGLFSPSLEMVPSLTEGNKTTRNPIAAVWTAVFLSIPFVFSPLRAW